MSLPNAQPLTRYHEAIDAQIAKALELKVKPDQLYEELCGLNREPAHRDPKAEQAAAHPSSSGAARGASCR